MLGGKDDVIPSEFGRKLFDGYSGPKQLWFNPEANRGDLHQGAPAAAKEVIEFWNNREAPKPARK